MYLLGYLGADIGHPGPGVAKPSAASLTFSYDEGLIYSVNGNTATPSQDFPGGSPAHSNISIPHVRFLPYLSNGSR
jgi:hypothetical protein